MAKLVLLAWAAALAVIAWRKADWLLVAAILCAPFEAAAVVSAGGIGISPYTVTMLLIAARCLILRVDAATFLGPTPQVRSAMKSLFLLLAIALLGTAVLPVVFEGSPVNSPNLNATVPLAFTKSNLAQAVYLLLNVAFVWYAGQKFCTAAMARRAVVATTIAGAIVVGFAFLQLASSVAGVPYPSEILYSNDSFAFQTEAVLLNMPRISSTFSEPAGMAVFLVGLLAYLTIRLKSGGSGTPLRVILLIGTVVALILSTSSTAYIGLAGVGALVVATQVIDPILRGTARPRTVILTLTALVVGVAGVVAAVRLDPDLNDVVNKMVFEKQDSTSYDERSGADRHAMRILASTYGLGVGLGSNRGSSFGPSMLSTIGVYGGAALVLSWVHLLRRPASDEATLRGWHQAAAAGLVGVIVAKLLSSPDFVTPLMWTMMATLVSVHGATTRMPAAPPIIGGSMLRSTPSVRMGMA